MLDLLHKLGCSIIEIWAHNYSPIKQLEFFECAFAIFVFILFRTTKKYPAHVKFPQHNKLNVEVIKHLRNFSKRNSTFVCLCCMCVCVCGTHSCQQLDIMHYCQLIDYKWIANALNSTNLPKTMPWNVTHIFQLWQRGKIAEPKKKIIQRENCRSSFGWTYFNTAAVIVYVPFWHAGEQKIFFWQ